MGIKHITAPALGNLYSKKRNRLDVLPITNDLLKLRNYLVEAIDHSIKAVKTKPNKQNFQELAEVCMARLYHVQQKKR